MIGVFDSGYGGLSVLRHFIKQLPNQDFLYLGDSGRAPYGGRSVHTILDFSEQAVERLFHEGCSLVIVACNTVSCVALRHLQQHYCAENSNRRILGITIPGAEAAVNSGAKRVAVVATQRTISSHTYVTEIHKLKASISVFERAAPLLAAIVEEGWQNTPIAELAVARYLNHLPPVDTVVLGCTHYPYLQESFKRALPSGTNILDPAPYAAERLVLWLKKHPEFNQPGTGTLRVLCTGNAQRFATFGERFLGQPLPKVERISEQAGHLLPSQQHSEPTGQVVRKTRR